MLKGKKIGLFITGGIASYKMAELSRLMIKKGAQVRVVMSKAATEFITPLTLQTLTKHTVLVDTFDEHHPEIVQHIHLADWCDYAIVAPATANIMAKMAQGLADDVVSTTLLAVHCPRLIVPAMNTNMYFNPATQRNIEQLKLDGYQVMHPDTGFLAEGYEGVGRLPELEKIVATVEQMIARKELSQILKGKRVVVSAGGTKERIDPVRYISNDSTGKMGYAMAKAAADLGAEVILVSTIDNLTTPLDVEKIKVTSAMEMFEVMSEQFAKSDIAMMTAAVSDYRVANRADQKIKKLPGQEGLTLELVENPDILKHLAQTRTPEQILIGFAAETQNVLEYAKTKVTKKQIDWIVANDVSRPDAGFNVDTNQVSLVRHDHKVIELPFLTKAELAYQIWEQILTN